MHMANELLSVPVAAGTLALAAGTLAVICKKAANLITSEKAAMMGIMGAFVFAAQMVNFQLPAMPGTSGHMVGAVLLAIVLGPHAGAIVIASVVIIQCLIFQDGGLLALGCNVINMGIVPCYLGYAIYTAIVGKSTHTGRMSLAAIVACIIAMEAGAVLVPIQAALSGVLVVPFGTFLVTMLGVHLLVGLVEGIITAAVLSYIRQTRPDIMALTTGIPARMSRKTVLASLVVATLIVSAGLSLLACGYPDGLEWSYAERPDQPEFAPMVSNDSTAIEHVDDFQARYAPLPDYSRRIEPMGQATGHEADVAAGWTSFAGVIGSAITMGLIWGIAVMLRKRQPQ